MVKFIFNNLSLILAGLLVVLGLGWLKSCSDLEKTEKKLKEKQAYISAVEDNQMGVFTTLNMTKSELQASRDSVNMFIDSLVKVKGYSNTIVRTELVESEFTKVDSVLFPDTIFVEDLSFDTIISNDRYYSCEVIGEYPSHLVIIPKVNSELVLFTHTVREYTGKPAKTKLGIKLREWAPWCRKKWREKYVTDVEDQNPYIKIKSARNIQIKED